MSRADFVLVVLHDLCSRLLNKQKMAMAGGGEENQKVEVLRKYSSELLEPPILQQRVGVIQDGAYFHCEVHLKQPSPLFVGSVRIANLLHDLLPLG